MLTDDGVARAAGPHGALVLGLAAPERRNAVRRSTVATLAAALAEDPARTVVLRSDVPDVFCAGADIHVDDASRKLVSDSLYALYEQMLTRPGIVVAVLDGAAVGGGAQLATAADVRIIGPSARLRWVGPEHGLAVGAWILPDIVGRGLAFELMLWQRWISAAESVQLGLASSVAESPGAALDELLAVLAAADPAAVARLKQIATSPGLLRRLREERVRNDRAWTGRAPSGPRGQPRGGEK